MDGLMPIPSPLHPRTGMLNTNQEWRDWSGWLAAAVYGHLHDREYYAIRSAAALIDISPLFKYEFTGPDALALADRIATRDLQRLGVGQVMYAPWCDDDGKVIDDGTFSRLGVDRLRVTAADPNLAWFEDCATGMNVQVTDCSEGLAALAIQGPNSRRILERALDGFPAGLKYYRLAECRAGSIPLTVSRTGYTGDLGYELWISAENAVAIWDLLMDAGEGFGIAPAGMAALDIARIEAGLVMNGVDYISSRRALIPNQTSTPYEIGLGWTVRLEKPAFVGQKALKAEMARGPKWTMVGLELDWLDLERVFSRWDLVPQVAGRASRNAVPVYRRGVKIGEMTSHTFSPLLKRYLGLASIQGEFAAPGTRLDVEVTVEYTRMQAKAAVCRLPFYDPPGKRA